MTTLEYLKSKIEYCNKHSMSCIECKFSSRKIENDGYWYCSHKGEAYRKYKFLRKYK